MLIHTAYTKSRPEPSAEERVKAALPLVRRLAFRMARRLPPDVGTDDLIAAGCEGLVRAAQSFDPARSPNFEAYARERIRGAMLDELRARDTMTSYGRRRLTQVTSAIAGLERELGRTPTEDEIARALDVDVTEYRKMSDAIARGPALARSAAEPDDLASVAEDPEAVVEAKLDRQRLAEAIRTLPERLQTVLALYYQEECTQAEIAQVLGVTESRVCQLLGEASARLRAKLLRDRPTPRLVREPRSNP